MNTLINHFRPASLRAFLTDASVWRVMGAWAFVAIVCVVLANALSA